MFQNEEAGLFEHGLGIPTYAHFDSQEWWVTIEFGGCPILSETFVVKNASAMPFFKTLYRDVWRSTVQLFSGQDLYKTQGHLETCFPMDPNTSWEGT
jgi:hypothetical protein